jgi:hypothetical protein
MMQEITYLMEHVGGPLGVAVIVLVGLGSGCWYILVRLFGRHDGIVTSIVGRNAEEVKHRIVDFLASLTLTLKQLADHNQKQIKVFTDHCTSDRCDHRASHAALGAIVNTILSILQSQDVLTNGEKRQVEQMLIEAKARLEDRS